jgi:hypothetical protein
MVELDVIQVARDDAQFLFRDDPGVSVGANNHDDVVPTDLDDRPGARRVRFPYHIRSIGSDHHLPPPHQTREVARRGRTGDRTVGLGCPNNGSEPCLGVRLDEILEELINLGLVGARVISVSPDVLRHRVASLRVTGPPDKSPTTTENEGDLRGGRSSWDPSGSARLPCSNRNRPCLETTQSGGCFHLCTSVGPARCG